MASSPTTCKDVLSSSEGRLLSAQRDPYRELQAQTFVMGAFLGFPRLSEVVSSATAKGKKKQI
jgi:hypothetical protein